MISLTDGLLDVFAEMYFRYCNDLKNDKPMTFEQYIDRQMNMISWQTKTLTRKDVLIYGK